MLHTVNKSPFEKTSLASCLRMACKGSSVLLIEDGVYAAFKGTSVSDALSKSMSDLSFYALEPDLKARGMSSDQVLEGIRLVDYAGFVDLVTSHDRVQSWL